VHPAGELREHAHSLVRVRGLAEHAAVHVDLGVARQDELALDRARLRQRVLEDDLARVALRELLDVGRANVELDPQLLEDRAPLGRGRGEG
jgi:hypothetical protein